MKLLSYFSTLMVLVLFMGLLKYAGPTSFLFAGFLVGLIFLISIVFVKSANLSHLLQAFSFFILVIIYLAEYFVDGALGELIFAAVSILMMVLLLVNVADAQHSIVRNKLKKKLKKLYAKNQKAEKSHAPGVGRFVASKTGKKYHVPGCDWAAKIGKNNRVFFSDKKDAEKNKYKACDCIK